MPAWLAALQGCQFFKSRHSQVCLLQEQVDSLQSDLEALRQKDRDRVAHFKDKARKQVIEVSFLSRVQRQRGHAGKGAIVGDASAACCTCHHTQEASATGRTSAECYRAVAGRLQRPYHIWPAVAPTC